MAFYITLIDDMSDLYREDRLDSRDIVELMSDVRSRVELADDEEEAEMHQAFLAELEELSDELSSYAGDSMTDGIFLIAEDTFKDYAQELAEDIGAIDRTLGWPSCHIDWEAAADSLKMDYTSIDIGGREYLYR